MPAPPGARFPYMFWAHEESFLAPYSLAQSGMPLPDLEDLRLEATEIYGFPTVEAQPAFEAAIARLFGLPPERVLATVGASGAMHMAAQCWFGPGNTILAETPSYEPLRVLPREAGGKVIEWERRLEQGWQLDLEVLEQAIREAKGPVHAFLTNPHNPTGAVTDEATMAQIAARLATTGGKLVCCEAYMEYAPRAEDRVHVAALAPNGVSISTLTKAYGLGGLRAGWMLFGEEAVKEKDDLIDSAYLTWIDPPTPSLVAGTKALERLPELIAPIRKIDAESRPHLDRWLRSSSLVEATVPPFGILSFPRVRGVTDTRAVARHLLEHHDVGIVPGEDFGAPGFLRVACGVPEPTLVEALNRLETGLQVWLERL